LPIQRERDGTEFSELYARSWFTEEEKLMPEFFSLDAESLGVMDEID
jgi:hypothetical protein